MSNLGKQVSLRINEPWDFEQETKIAILNGKVQQEIKESMLIALSKPVTYQNVTFDKIVAAPFKTLQLKATALLQIAPVVETVQLQAKELDNADFKAGSDFHRAASWRAWFLQGKLV